MSRRTTENCGLSSTDEGPFFRPFLEPFFHGKKTGTMIGWKRVFEIAQVRQSLHFAGMQNNTDTGSGDRKIVMNSYGIKCRIIEEELKTFWPQWRVIRRLGGGAFGDVFEIYRDSFGIREKSALKMLQISDGAETVALITPEGGAVSHAQDQDGSAEIPEAFRNEIQIMEELKGAPNIVIIEGFHLKRDESATMLFVRMELLTSFQQMMTERQRDQLPFTIPEVLKIGRDICTALMYCEEKGIIHRDIKPANLFKDNFGNYKVGDFGVSRRMDTVHVALTMTGIGTISYMAPEVYRGTSYNNTVDIYALGLILYQLLNNYRIPFLPTEGSYTTKDIDSANYKRLHGEPLPSLTGTRIANETVDASLDAMIRKACALRSEDRYQSAKEFYEDLAAWGTTQAKKPQEDIPQRQPQEKQPQESMPQRQPQAKKPQESIPQRQPQAEQPQKSIPQRQSQNNIPKGIQRQSITHQEQYSQSEKHSQNAGLYQENEQYRTTPISFGRDDPDKVEDTHQKRDRNPQAEPAPGEDVTGSVPSHSIGSDRKEPVSGNGKKIGRSVFAISAALLVIIVFLICFVYRPRPGSQQTPSSTSASELSDSAATAYKEAEGNISDSGGKIITSGEIKGPISDSWDEIIAAGEDGTYAEKYHIGDTKELDLGEEGVIRMELVALDTDELSDGSGKAHMTWIAKDLLNSNHCMNEEDTNEGGWVDSDMRAWLQESILPLLQDNVGSNIKEVTKYSYSFSNGGTISSNDSIWIPSAREVFETDDLWNKYAYEKSGVKYSLAFSDDEYRVKNMTGTSDPSWWWLRSANSSSFNGVGTDGRYGINYATIAGGVAIGFCL